MTMFDVIEYTQLTGEVASIGSIHSLARIRHTPSLCAYIGRVGRHVAAFQSRRRAVGLTLAGETSMQICNTRLRVECASS